MFIKDVFQVLTLKRKFTDGIPKNIIEQNINFETKPGSSDSPPFPAHFWRQI